MSKSHQRMIALVLTLALIVSTIAYGTSTSNAYAVSGGTVDGTVTSYVDGVNESAYTYVGLYSIVSGVVATEASYSTRVLSNGAAVAYSFSGVADGSYALVVSKSNHVSKTQTITVSGSNVSVGNTVINLIGDVNGDGSVNTIDVSLVNSVAKKLTTINDYQTSCADVSGDGLVNTVDVGRINSHVKGVKSLFSYVAEPTATSTPTAEATATNTPTVTATNTPTPGATNSPTPGATNSPTATPSPVATAQIPTYTFDSETIPSNEAMEFAANMGIGWNLGNTFDSTGSGLSAETYWQSDYTTTALIDELYAAGFRTIRIPVSWHTHCDENYEIDEKWLARVTEIVDYAYDKGMYVIINTHHDIDTSYIWPQSAYKTQSENYLTKIWTQLCANFADYGERLIFEGMNEPRVIGDTNEWWYSSSSSVAVDAVDCINEYNQVFVDTVRAAGGNNANRYLMIGSMDTSPDCVLIDQFEMPTDTADNKLIISIHMYSSYDFTQNTSGRTEFTSTDINENLSYITRIYNQYVSRGIPVVMGEFGAINKGTESERLKYYSYVAGCAENYGIVPVVWDNNAYISAGIGNSFGLIKRSTCTWDNWNIILSMMQYYFDVDTSVYDANAVTPTPTPSEDGLGSATSDQTDTTIISFPDPGITLSKVDEVQVDVTLTSSYANGGLGSMVDGSWSQIGWEISSAGSTTITWSDIGGFSSSALQLQTWYISPGSSSAGVLTVTEVRYYDSSGNLLATQN